jgi:hypothetical protein
VEGLEVLGDILLGGTKIAGQIPHASFTGSQTINDPQAHRFSQEPELRSDQVGQIVGKG